MKLDIFFFSYFFNAGRSAAAPDFSWQIQPSRHRQKFCKQDFYL